MLADLRHALRQLHRAPGFAAAVVLCLALGIGVNVALFGVVNALLFRPPAGVRAPEELRRLRDLPVKSPGRPAFFGAVFSYPDVEALRERRETFAGIAAASGSATNVAAGSGAAAEQLAAVLATADYFATLGVRPALGRFFGPARGDEDAPVVVLGHGYWQRAYGGRASALGRTILLNGRPFEIVGVAPAGFVGFELGRPDVWLPLGNADVTGYAREMIRSRNMSWLTVAARLRPGVSTEQASAVAQAAIRASDAEPRPAREGRPLRGGARVVRASAITERFGSGAGLRPSPVPVWLLGASGAVLLVACANVANLLLARGERRRAEIATRVALGAGRGRVVRQMLAESLVLAAMGGALGLVVGAWGVWALGRLPTVPPLDRVFDARVAAFTFGAVLAATLGAGLVPALRAGRGDVGRALTGGKRATPARSPLRAALMVVQLAASLALLAVGGLFVRSLRNVRAIDVGFDMAHLVAASAQLPPETVAAGGDGAAIFERAAAAVRRLPDVEGVTLTPVAPFRGSMRSSLEVPGHEPRPGDPPALTYVNQVDSAYFRVLRTPVLRGRAFGPHDRAAAGPDGQEPLVVNAAFARTYWTVDEAVGKCVRRGEGSPCRPVVGVVGDAKATTLQGDVEPTIYSPYAQAASEDARGTTLLVRTRGRPEAAVAAVRAAFQSADPRIVFVNARTVASHVAAELAPWQLGAAAFTLFGLLALAVAAVGLYGVVAYGVAQRTGEIAVRLALGARGRDVVRLVVRQGLTLTAAGVAAGAAAGLAVTRLVRAQLYGVSPHDPATFAGVTLALAVVAVVASYLPARRAARVDPMTALRSE